MKLRKIKWKSHDILGDLELDFTNTHTGKPYDTIVIAGENGTGKTSILETIYNFLNQGPIEPFEFVEYQIDDNIYQAIKPNNTKISTFFDIKDLSSGIMEQIRYDRIHSPEKIKTTFIDPRHYGCAYTKARTNYITQKIDKITAKTIDKNIYDNEEDKDATSLKQLIIDIQNQDNNDFAIKSRAFPENSVMWKDFEPQSRIYRFSSAFNQFFGNILKYDRIEIIGESYEVIFKKNNKDIKLDKLSTGESQIIFRGTYLLKNIGRMNGSIFIDEPEISMHPCWQKKILSYYKMLCTENNNQKNQIIAATHSEGVIAEALKDDNAKVIVLRSDQNGIICPGDIETPLVLKNTSSAEISYQAFDTASTDYHNALYGYIEANDWINAFETQQGQTEDYIKNNRDGSTSNQKICLSEKIRHIIHHPENTHNKYTDQEIKKSIEEMRKFILAQN